MSLFVVSYDISDNARRRRVARSLLAYGERIQLSVFEVWLEPEDMVSMRREVGVLLGRTDRFELFPIDRRNPEQRISWQQSPRTREAVILVG